MKKKYFTPATKVMTINCKNSIMEPDVDETSSDPIIFTTTDEPLF